MPAIAGLRGTGDFSADERPKSFREVILKRDPNGEVPMTALLSRANKEQVSDAEFNWWDEPTDIIRLQVAGALGATDTIVTVDSLDPDATNPERVWGVATHLVPGDLLMVEKTTETSAFDHEIVEVINVISPTQFTVKRGAAGTTAAAIGDNLFLLHIGSAYPEGSPAPKSASRNPAKYFNYCQIFKTIYELTNTAMVTEFRTGDPLRNDKNRKMFDHMRGIETAIMFGRKSETTGSNGKPLRTMGGLRSFISPQTTTIFSVAATYNSLLDAVSKVFDFSSPAGDTRIAFVGNGALNAMNKIIKADTVLQLQTAPPLKVFGMNMRELTFPQGTLMLRRHPLMSRNSFYTNSMFIVDFSSLRWRHTKGRDTKFKDNVQLPDEDTTKGMWLTEGGLEVWYGGLTNGYIGNITA